MSAKTGLKAGKDGNSKGQRVRRTAACQIMADLAQMAATIASHDRKSQADVVDPVLRPFLLAQMARVQAEIAENLKRAKAQ